MRNICSEDGEDASLRLLPRLLLWLRPWPWRSRLVAAVTAAAMDAALDEDDSLASEAEAGTDSRLSTSAVSPSVA